MYSCVTEFTNRSPLLGMISEIVPQCGIEAFAVDPACVSFIVRASSNTVNAALITSKINDSLSLGELLRQVSSVIVSVSFNRKRRAFMVGDEVVGSLINISPDARSCKLSSEAKRFIGMPMVAQELLSLIGIIVA